MGRHLRLRPSPSMIVALIALCVALGGSAYAAWNLPANSIGTKQLKNGAVSGAKLRNNAVTSVKVQDGSLLAKDFRRGQLPAGATGPSDAYYASTRDATYDSEFQPIVYDPTGSVSLSLPAGHYIASGDCTATAGDQNGAPLTLNSYATAYLSATDGQRSAAEATSVPNVGTVSSMGRSQAGAASLSVTSGFSLPTAEALSLSCSIIGGSGGRSWVGQLQITAIKVRSLHNQNPGG
jgi:hypothetical protein